jgi:hypothetical protein
MKLPLTNRREIGLAVVAAPTDKLRAFSDAFKLKG